MSPRAIGRTIGALFLLAFVAYIAGSALTTPDPTTDNPLPDVADNPTRVAVGALLMLVNSAVVVGIGVLAFPVLRPHDELAAHAYLIGRAIEATLLAAGIVFLLLLVPLAREHADTTTALPALARIAVAGNHYSYQLAMISLGAVGVLFCRALLRARLVPRFLAVWGLVGYAVFLLGAVLEVLGYGVGVALSVPGGLFEVALGALLIAKGFPTARSGTGTADDTPHVHAPA